MGVASVKSPTLIDPEALVLIDLQLFGPFDVKTEESYAAAEAQADDETAPEDYGNSAAQDDDDQAQEQDHQDDGEDATPESDTDEHAGEEDESDDEAQADTKAAPSKKDELILGKFKDYAALEAAYEEAQRQLGRLHREIAEQRRKEAQTPAAEQKPPEPEKTPEQIAEENRKRLREFLKDPAGYEAKIIERARQEALGYIQQTQEQLTQREQTAMAGIQQVAEKYSDFADLEPVVRAAINDRPSFRRVAEILQKDPNVTADDFAALVEDAYLWAKSQSASAALESAREQGRKEATAAMRQRNSANVARQGTRRDQTRETAEDRIRREIVGAGRSRGIWRD